MSDSRSLSNGQECDDFLESFFASPERDGESKLKHALHVAANNPLINSAMEAFGGLIAVLNGHRQVLTLNTTMLSAMGIDDPESVFGLRPGEMLGCIHAWDNGAGCGTSKTCSTCGAAIAMVSCLEEGDSVVRECIITVEKERVQSELSFNLRATPLFCNTEQFILLFLEDRTEHKRRQSLERAFYHDVNNIIQSLCGVSELLALEGPSSNFATVSKLGELSQRLNKEVQIQRALSLAKGTKYPFQLEQTSVNALLHKLEVLCAGHPLARERKLTMGSSKVDISLKTDVSLCLRILTNMVINALEATGKGDEIRAGFDSEAAQPRFFVWNPGVIPEKVALRIFERFYSTKASTGRGNGTYAMKLFGETVLGGKVSFTSDEQSGTTFYFELPKQ